MRFGFRFGILQRYVMAEVFRAFALALLTITAVFVLLTVMAKAATVGLGPAEIAKLVPFMIPTSLPYTVPVSLLFAATVVYGRLASDNEVIATKTAGLSAMVLLWPSIWLALILSVTLSYLSATAIPSSNNRARLVIYQNVEDFFYKTLKREKICNFPNWPFLIQVRDVQERQMIGAMFKKRSEPAPGIAGLPPAPGAADPDAFDMVVQAKQATIKFDFPNKMVTVYFTDADIRKGGLNAEEAHLKNTEVPMPIPGKGTLETGKTTEEMTVAEMDERKADYREKIALERKRQAVAAAWFIGSGRIDKVDWSAIHLAFKDFDYWSGEIQKYETEFHMRLAMAWGSLFFVILGAPVGILFARRDFLSAFISCFMPIILVYYPCVLFGVNMGKEGIFPPYTVWGGNILLALIAGAWALPPILKN